TFGLGAAVTLADSLLVDADAVWDFDTAALIGRPDSTEMRYHIGAELSLAQRLGLRGGYIQDDARLAKFICFGASLGSPQVALDFGLRSQVDGPGEHMTQFGLSLRLVLDSGSASNRTMRFD